MHSRPLSPHVMRAFHRDRSPGDDRQSYGRRVLLSTAPQTPPLALAPYAPKNRDTIIDTGDLGDIVPVHVEIRFANYAPSNGAPVMPFRLVPQILPFGANVDLEFTIRRGVDQIGTPTEDKCVLHVGTANYVRDRFAFDTIACGSLGVDVAIVGDSNPLAALWVEAIATVVDQPSDQTRIKTYNSVVDGVVPANAGAVVLAPERSGRRQLYICNTSTNANLWVRFNTMAFVGQATFVLPANSFATYESQVECFGGVVWGIWDNGAPNGSAMVTEGIEL